ncbi:histidine phosphatase family protein [Enterococcus sp. BWM-S5]|uniref:Histidine phosphatase family protein n=1 Tax=Enterococcus larvae TaxID=2794352 RepID=A0ABS4CP49_9ENTE|nr:histidine phosphatase family protein [Enterococcus larvae]MBP1047782.1 histidine phosphatase family protein [Enterococcus larvae]
MRKKLYLVRHGETLFNKLGKVQGACDSPLTAKGIQQAEQVRDYFKEKQIDFDHFYTSTQERASDTLEIITNGKPYTRLKEIKEMNFGLYEGEQTSLQPKGPDYFETFYTQFGGECAQDVEGRMVEALTKVMNTPDHQQVLAVSHNGACFYFLRKIWNDPKKEIPIHFPNCAIFSFDYYDNTFLLLDILDPSTMTSIL